MEIKNKNADSLLIDNESKEITIEEFFNLSKTGKYEIMTNDGFKEIGDLYLKKSKQCYKMILSNGNFLEASEDHLVQVSENTTKNVEYLDGNSFKRLKNIFVGDLVNTKLGYYTVDSIINIGIHDTYDLEVLSNDHIYESNGIYSHNTGKSAIVEGLAKKIKEKNVSFVLHGKRIVTLDLSLIVAGTKYRGQFEERMKAIMDEIELNPDVIIFIDEVHTIIGAGNSAGSLDVSNMIKPALARGNMQIIGATTVDEYKQSIEKDGAMERRFQKVTIDEPSKAQTIEILRKIKSIYEEFHNVTYDDKAIVAAVEYSDRYITSRFQPDKSIDIIDEVGAKIHIDNIKLPIEIADLQAELDQLYIDKSDFVKKQKYEAAAKIRDKEKTLIAQIDKIKIKWGEDQKKNKIMILEEDVAKVVSKMVGIPITKITEDEGEKLLKMEEALRKRVIGQDNAIAQVVAAVQRSRTGVSNKKKPIASFLFLGDTAVGKTELAKALTEYLFNDESSLIRLDMSEYMDKFTISRLIGSPPGYVGYEEGGQLTEKVRLNPYSVILLDEIEKAHPDIFNLLLQVLDEGHLTDGMGKKINFKNTILIMTSNAGTKELTQNKPLGFNNNSIQNELHTKSIIDKALGNIFRKETLNRIDEQIIFKKFNKEEILQITEIHLENFFKSMREQGYTIKGTNNLKEFIAEEGYSEEFGIRPIHRAITKFVENSLSREILLKKIKAGDSIVVDYNTTKKEIEIKKSK